MALHDEYAAILRDHPPRVDTASFAAEAGAAVHAGAAAAVQAVLSREIGAGRELGVQVYAYRHGRLQLAVVAGVHRPMGDGWRGLGIGGAGDAIHGVQRGEGCRCRRDGAAGRRG